MPKKPTKTPAIPCHAMAPFDIETMPEARAALASTISEIATDFLAKGLRVVRVPIGQAKAVKSAFEAATSPTDGPGGPIRRWRVDVVQIVAHSAELRFSTEGDPTATVSASVLLPRVDELLAWSRTPEAEVFGDETPLGKILGNLRVLRAMVDG